MWEGQVTPPSRLHEPPPPLLQPPSAATSIGCHQLWHPRHDDGGSATTSLTAAAAPRSAHRRRCTHIRPRRWWNGDQDAHRRRRIQIHPSPPSHQHPSTTMVDRRPSHPPPPSHTDPPNLLRSTHHRIVRPASKPWPGAALLRLPRLLAGAAANTSGTLAVPRAASARRPPNHD